MNLKDDGERCLLAAWLLFATITNYEKPLLVIFGPAGSAKSSTASMLKDLIDPENIGRIKSRNSEAEMAQILQKHPVPLIDNMTSVNQDIADLLCLAATGGVFKKRKLYTDSEDVVYHLQKPVITTSVNIWTNATDLLDRCVFIELLKIRKTKEASKVKEHFLESRDKYFHGFLTALSKTLSIYNSIDVATLPRMADFFRWGCAAAEALGFSHETFSEAFYQSRLKGQLAILDEDSFGRLLIEYLEVIGEGSWPYTRFYNGFMDFATKKKAQSVDLPKSSSAFSRKIGRSLYFLEAFGWSISKKPNKDCNNVVIHKL
jgi:hypothetical protein